MNAVFLATSEHHVLSLDADGICRVVTPCGKPGAGRDVSRCLGAQFVATLDPAAPGLLALEPRAGASMLFIRIDDGRASLLRFGPVVAFESLEDQAPVSSYRTIQEPSTVRNVGQPAGVAARTRKASGVVIRNRAAGATSTFDGETPAAPRAYRSVTQSPPRGTRFKR